MTKFRAVAPDLDLGPGLQCTMSTVDSNLRPEVLTVDRLWNPTDPAEPHVEVMQRGGLKWIQLVSPVGPGFLIDSDSPLVHIAQAIWAFAQDSREYALRERKPAEGEEDSGRVEELERQLAESDDDVMRLRDTLVELLEGIAGLEKQLERIDPKGAVLIELRHYRTQAEEQEKEA